MLAFNWTDAGFFVGHVLKREESAFCRIHATAMEGMSSWSCSWPCWRGCWLGCWAEGIVFLLFSVSVDFDKKNKENLEIIRRIISDFLTFGERELV